MRSILAKALFLLTTLVLTSTANAQPGYETILSKALGVAATPVACQACHNSLPSSENATNAVNPIALTWKQPSLDIRYTDSDGDGFSNIQEASGALLNFNDPYTSPFTINALAASSLTANTAVIGALGATETVFTDPYGLASNASVIGGISVTLGNVATVTYKAGGVLATDSVYTVDPYGQGTLAAQGIDWTATSDGSLSVLALPNGVANASYVVVRANPIVPAPVAAPDTQPTNTTNVSSASAGGGGCLSTNNSMMLVLLLPLCMVFRKKKATVQLHDSCHISNF